MKHEELTEKIIGCCYNVYNALGSGFLEKVYENALAVEFEEAELKFGQQVGIDVLYKDKNVGNYVADFIVEGKVVLEIKAMIALGGIEKAQVINYLKATEIDVGLLINFGKKVEVRRVFWGN